MKLALAAAAVAALLGAVVAYGIPNGDPPEQRTCISAVGPVNAQGGGDTTPEVAGECP